VTDTEQLTTLVYPAQKKKKKKENEKNLATNPSKIKTEQRRGKGRGEQFVRKNTEKQNDTGG